MAICAEQLAAICDQLAEGKSLRAICRERDLSESSVRRWLAQDGDATAQYAHARELQADSYFDAVIDIADDTTLSADDRRIRIDARKWAAGKLNGKYSDKLAITGNTTVTHKHDLNTLDTGELEQLEAILAKSERGSGNTGKPESAAVY